MKALICRGSALCLALGILTAVPAFAGTATYVGSHTAGDARLTDYPPGLGNMVVNYDGANISFSADGGVSYVIFPDEAGEEVSFGRGDYVFTMVIESATLPDYNVTPVMFGVMTMAENDTGQWAYVANDAGADLIVGSTQKVLEWTITPPAIASPVTFPVTLTIERSGTTMTTSAVDAEKAVLDLGTNTLVPPVDFMGPRIFFFDSDGVSVPGSSMTVSLIEISGDLVPDVNQPGGGGGATVVVEVGDNFFDPPNVTINVGDTVQWNWVGTVMGHTVTSGTGGGDANSGDLFDTGPAEMTSGQFEHTFTEVGVEPYYCIPHEITDNMKGTITVQAEGGGVGSIVFDNASFGGESYTLEHTIGGGVERMLVVGVGREFDTTLPTSEITVSYGGVEMIRIPGADARAPLGAIHWGALFWLDDSGLPGAGAWDVVVAGSDPTVEPFTTIGAISLEGVAQGPPEAAANAVDDNGGLLALDANITTLTDGSWTVDVIGSGSGNDTGTTVQVHNPTVQTRQGSIEGFSNTLTMSTYEVSPAGATTIGYTIDQQSGGANRLTLSVAAFAPGTPPVFSIQPRGATVLIGSSHIFEVALSEPVSPSYQWMRDIGSGAENVGTDLSTLNLTDLLEADSGDYWVVVTDDGGPFTSNMATLRVVTSVPTAQTWGLLCVTLLLLGSGAYFVRRRALQRR